MKSFESRAHALETLAAPRPVVCEFGFEHGLLDALAASEASLEAYEDLIRVCTSHTGPQRDLCTDGAGHSIWQRYRDLDAALGFCLKFEQADSGRGGARCLGGVIMQFFRSDSVTGKPAAFEPTTGVGVVDTLCRAAAASSAELAEPCYAYGAEPMALTFNDDTTMVLGREQADFSTGNEVVRRAARKAVAACDYYEQYASSCRDRLRESARVLLRGQVQYLEAYCSVWIERSETCG